MAQHGKRYRAAVATLTREDLLSPEDALRRVKELAVAKFDETVELVLRLGVDPRSGDQMVRGTVNLPHGSGKSPRVIAFARGEDAQKAEQAGADVVGAEDVVARIEGGWKEFDVLVATREMMRVVGRLGKRLGPRMPNPKAGTVGPDIAKMVQDLKGGRIQFRLDRGGNIHVPVGKASYTVDQLKENVATVMAAVLRARPAGAKGQYLRRVAVSSTMGPSVILDPAEAQLLAETAM
jgi:large subunit ribosomal protein L1